MSDALDTAGRERIRDRIAIETRLRRRLDTTPWWISQILPDPDGELWIVTLTHDVTALKVAHTHTDRLEALRLAVEYAEGGRRELH